MVEFSITPSGLSGELVIPVSTNLASGSRDPDFQKEDASMRGHTRSPIKL